MFKCSSRSNKSRLLLRLKHIKSNKRTSKRNIKRWMEDAEKRVLESSREGRHSRETVFSLYNKPPVIHITTDFFSFFFIFCIFRATSVAYGGSQARESNQSYSCRPALQPQQCRSQALSVTCTRAYGNHGSLTHWVRWGTEPLTSWMLVRFVSTELWWELCNNRFVMSTLACQVLGIQQSQPHFQYFSFHYEKCCCHLFFSSTGKQSLSAEEKQTNIWGAKKWVKIITT